MRTMGTVETKIQGLKGQMQAVTLNRDLSDAGREKQLAALQKQLADYQPQALATFQREANAIRKEFHTLNFERWPAAVEAAARGWDFQRLGYERAHMESELAALKATTGDPLSAIEKQYSLVMSGGDKYQMRVWSEIGPGLALQFGGAALAKVMEQNAERLRTTDEMLSIQEQSGKLALRASALKRDIKDVMPQLSYDGQLALGKVMAGIHVSERIVPQTLTLETSLSVDDAATPTAEGAPGGAAAVAV